MLVSDWAIRVAAFAIFFAVWSYLGSTQSRVVFASPAGTWRGFVTLIDNGELVDAWRQSLIVLFAGLGISVGLGVLMGIAVGRYHSAGHLITPPVTAIFMTPKIALLPIISLWWGYQTFPKIVVVALFGFFQVFYTVLGGVRTIEGEYLEVSRAYSIRGWRLIRQIVVPACLPYIITALRLGLLNGMVGVVLVGFFLETTGIGGLIDSEASEYRISTVFVALISVAVVGVVINFGLRVIERLVLPWKGPEFA